MHVYPRSPSFEPTHWYNEKKFFINAPLEYYYLRLKEAPKEGMKNMTWLLKKQLADDSIHIESMYDRFSTAVLYVMKHTFSPEDYTFLVEMFDRERSYTAIYSKNDHGFIF